jgi:CheY-like chemotaxis protein
MTTNGAVQRTAKYILVAEDEAMNRQLIREVLELRGFKVVEASDGQQAFEKALACPPDLMIVDIQMPILNGLDLMDRVKREPTLSEIPVVALTALAVDRDLEKAENSGFAGYVTKPFNMSKLYSVIEKCLQEVALRNPGGVNAGADERI